MFIFYPLEQGLRQLPVPFLDGLILFIFYPLEQGLRLHAEAVA